MRGRPDCCARAGTSPPVARPLNEDGKQSEVCNIIDAVRCVRNCSCALLYLAAFMTHAGMAEDPAGRVRALIVADEESAKVPPGRWPDVSPKALRDRETLDRATLDKLHAVARNDLAREDRTIYDLFEWLLNRRLEQFRLRLYLTPFWNDDRYVGFAAVLGSANVLSRASRENVKSFPAYVNQAVALLREGIRARMLPSAELVGCTNHS
jgi:uncharacterized protein (DUF885 family)